MRTALCLLLLTASILAGTAHGGDKPAWSMATRLYSDRTARRVGDILTVVIAEESKTSRDSDKKTEKNFKLNGAFSVGSPLIDGVPRASWTNTVVPKWSLDTKRTFSGLGSMANKDEFSAKVAVCVTEVLPNGNLIIEGKRMLVVQDERVEMVLTGTIRPEDIASDNTVQSTRLADASISYRSTGSIARNQNKGLLSKLWDWVNIF